MQSHGVSLNLRPEIFEQVLKDYFSLAVNDSLIGFLFSGINIQRLIQKELELILGFLGHDIAYTGKSLREAHHHLCITTGQFNRRIILLRQAMEKNKLPRELMQQWLSHNEQAREIIIHKAEKNCENSNLDC